jgi:hypothetical protein
MGKVCMHIGVAVWLGYLGIKWGKRRIWEILGK